jgi:hypothetical protein
VSRERGMGRLLVVDPHEPSRLVGIREEQVSPMPWVSLLGEEEIWEAGWITARARLLRRQVRQLLHDRRSA